MGYAVCQGERWWSGGACACLDCQVLLGSQAVLVPLPLTETIKDKGHPGGSRIVSAEPCLVPPPCSYSRRNSKGQDSSQHMLNSTEFLLP